MAGSDTADTRPPPSNVQAEEAVLGAILADNTALLRIDLSPGDFYSRDCRLIFRAMQGLASEQKAIDVTTVYDKLRHHVSTDELAADPTHMVAGSMASYLAELPDISGAHIHDHAGIVKETAGKRQIIEAAQRIIQQAQNGTPVEALTEDLAAAADRLKPRAAQLSAADLGLIPASQLESIANEEQDYIVHGLLPKGWLSLFVADPKCGKSVVVRNLIHEIMRGGQWLGRDVEQEGKVLYLSWEEGEDDVYRHFAQMGTDLQDAKLSLSFRRGRFDPTEWAYWLGQAIDNVQPALVVIDTLARLIPFEEINEYGRTMQTMDVLTNIARTSGAHITALHHTRKAGGEHGAESMGSQAIYGSADMMIRLKRQGEQRYISTDGRPHDRITEPLAIIWDEVTGLISVGDSAGDLEYRALQDEIFALLDRAEEPLRLQAIRKTLKRSQTTTHRALLSLVKKGSVEQIKDGRKLWYQRRNL